MRKVPFYIDDAECFRAEFISSGLTEEQTDKLVSDMKGFKAVYTLYGDGCFPDRDKCPSPSSLVHAPLFLLPPTHSRQGTNLFSSRSMVPVFPLHK